LIYLGVFFICFAFWWHINNCLRYIKSLASENNGISKRKEFKFEGSTTYPCICIPGKVFHRLPIESILKIIITTIHISIELHNGYNTKPRVYIGTVNAHHTAMLFGFFLSAWVEVLVHYGVPLPKRTNQAMGFIAFAMEGLMLMFHLHARSLIDTHIHQLLALTIGCSMIGAIGECFDPNNFWFILVRSYFALTQGTWFIQAAYVLWPASKNPIFIWDPNSSRSMSLLTMSYAYHLAGNTVVIIVVYLLVYMYLSSSMKRKYNQEEDDEATDEYKLIVNANDEDNVV
jgi:uncharacterized membrane protein